MPAAGIPHRRRWWPYGRVQVSGSSMRPTLADGDRLLVRWGAAPRPGKLVVVRLPDGTPAVKRAFGRDGAGWWVERDNPQEGVDSWQVGAIPAADVLGTIVLRYRRGS
ncbi:MAG TPA: S24/S26 family peptidase [Mycobacteriales bacterium]|nr:S24/S26 family peptidase [Mycobacteriales bacterium]